MKIWPLGNYQLLGTNIVLTTGSIYDAEPAWNNPEYKEKGLVFCNGIMLDKTEYVIAEN